MSLSKGSYTSARELISEEEAKEAVSNRRVLICNVWRNISTFPVKRQPLALLDCSTTKPSEFFTVELVFEDRIGENQGVVPSKDHNWYYFPDMLKDEALIFKTYDSLDDGVTSRFTMHTAFADPSTQSNHPTRESIEVRVVAIMPPK
uniref:Uncharacterized protein n=1 Tax=Arcella intermedia TaxID=1963864 RepID=A0A6B2LIE6_9EUKA